MHDMTTPPLHTVNMAQVLGVGQPSKAKAGWDSVKGAAVKSQTVADPSSTPNPPEKNEVV